MQQILQVTAQSFAQSYRCIFLDLPNCNHYICGNVNLPRFFFLLDVEPKDIIISAYV